MKRISRHLRVALLSANVIVAFAIGLIAAPILSEEALTNNRTIELVRNGNSDDSIIAAINSSAPAFDLSTAGVRSLPAAGVSERVIHEMAKSASVPVASKQVQPASLFDSLAVPAISIGTTTVEVHDTGRQLDAAEPAPFQAGGAEIISSAGTYGDVSRYLQVLPGVVGTSDLSNEILVRGGHPMENLFLVDGIEVPNINHVALAGTTGGFGPMIDSALIQDEKIYTGGYDAQYPERLSSVTEIRSLENTSSSGHLEGDIGIQGFGGLHEQKLDGGDLLTAVHHGVMDWMGKSFGVDGIPAYTNEFSRFRKIDSSGNRFLLMNVAGGDSTSLTPCPEDPDATSTIDSQYSAWRETTGGEWQRIYSASSFGVFSLSDSEQVEHIHQQDQLPNPTATVSYDGGPCALAPSQVNAVPVYAEDSNDAFSSAAYKYAYDQSKIQISAGATAWLQRPDYNVSQPIGTLSPYSVDPTRSDSASFSSQIKASETASFGQFTFKPAHNLALSAGFREQTFSFGHHTTVTPRVSLRYQPRESIGFHLAFAQYAQMPPYVYLLAYPVNRAMLPMRAVHEMIGIDLFLRPTSQIRIEAYSKQYTDIPASTEYPSVTLHDMVAMIGDQIVWLPMNSTGKGKSSGIELSDITRIRNRFTFRASIAYSRAMFAGTDHALRPSNFDLPWIVNVVGLERLRRCYEFSFRYGYASGRPYTAFDLPDTELQNRPIYDVANMNALRAPSYSRLDAQLNKEAHVRGLRLEIYAGVENILDRSNFLTYVWMPRAKANGKYPIQELYQIPIFPNAGARLIFR